MPHVIVKLWPGKSESQKRRLAQVIADDVMKVLNCGVYRPDIVDKPETLYKRPGYEM